jgi:hypothetical protein
MTRDQDSCHKIGRSIRPTDRAATLRCHLVWTIRADDAVWLESYLHRAFAEHRKDGEWFDLPDWVVNELVEVDEILDDADLPEWIKGRHAANTATIPPKGARPRIQADVSEEVRRAILIVAAENDTSAGEIVEQLVRQTYPQQVKRAEELIAKQGKKAPPPKPAK